MSDLWAETIPVRSVADFGKAINRQRHKRHLSQKRLGAAADVAHTAISRLELDRDDTVSLGIVLRLVNALGLDLELRPRGSRFTPRPPTQLNELGLSPITMSALRHEGLDSVHQLGSATEMLTRPAFTDGLALFELVCAINRYGLSLSPNGSGARHVPDGRAQAMFKLRIVDGFSLTEIARICERNPERVRQILHSHFGLTGEPPTASRRRKMRAQQRRQGE